MMTSEEVKNDILKHLDATRAAFYEEHRGAIFRELFTREFLEGVEPVNDRIN